MKKALKAHLHLAALTVALFALIAFTVHYDDEPLKHCTRSFVKQKIFSSGLTAKIKTPLSMPFRGTIITLLHINALSCIGNFKPMVQTPTGIFSRSVSPYRGPPTAIPC